MVIELSVHKLHIHFDRIYILLLLLLYPFEGLFTRTTWVSRYRKGKISLDLNAARDDGSSAGPQANNLHLTSDR